MKIISTQLGEINYNKEDLILFKDGLYGFEQYTEFLYIQNNNDSIFSYLQSIQNPSITFIVVSGYEVINNFELQVSKDEMENIFIEKEEDICSLLIVTVPQDISKITINLLGPIVINSQKRIGKQMISLHPEHTTKHPLLNNKEISIEQKIG